MECKRKRPTPIEHPNSTSQPPTQQCSDQYSKSDPTELIALSQSVNQSEIRGNRQGLNTWAIWLERTSQDEGERGGIYTRIVMHARRRGGEQGSSRLTVVPSGLSLSQSIRRNQRGNGEGISHLSLLRGAKRGETVAERKKQKGRLCFKIRVDCIKRFEVFQTSRRMRYRRGVNSVPSGPEIPIKFG